jgi:CheY-like chemotaxis protein
MTKASIFYIIDDDRDDQDYLIAALKEIDPNTEYFTAFNGQEGFRKLELGLIPIPSVIFLDMNMPRVNGRQFLMAMKKKSSIPGHSYRSLFYLRNSKRYRRDETIRCFILFRKTTRLFDTKRGIAKNTFIDPGSVKLFKMGTLI